MFRVVIDGGLRFPGQSLGFGFKVYALWLRVHGEDFFRNVEALQYLG